MPQYFTWPLFVIRLLTILALYPGLICFGVYAAYKKYMRERKYVRYGLIQYVFNCQMDVLTMCGLFIIGGTKMFPIFPEW